MVRAYLEREIPKMTHASWLYKVLKAQLTALGHWKNLPRGKPGMSEPIREFVGEPQRVEIGDDFAERVLNGQ